MGVERKVAAAVGGARGKKASPPIFSHEFFIQNHGDIVSCVIMVIIVGFMFQATAPISAIFVSPQYNETVTFPSEYGDYSLNLYRNGVRDVFTVVFYTIAWITVHAIIQEYILDKLQRKVHLSKTKTTKFTESGHLLVFSVYSVVHAGYLLADFITAYSDLPRVWTNYPEEHKYLSMNLKMFFILQISYWVHQFPEFYFQKVKKEDARPRAFVAALFIGFISFAYVVNFTRLALVILLLEYTSLTVFHITRILHFLEKKTVAKTGFKIWNGVFVLVRIATAVLAVTTFWYGLRQSEVPHIDIAAGNFNTSYIRLNSLLAILILQLLQLWNFLSFHLGRLRDSRSRKQKTGDSKPSHQKKEKKEKHREEDELPEADQATAKKTTKKQKAN